MQRGIRPPNPPIPFAKLTELELAAMAREVLAALHCSDAHPIPSTKGMTFADIEPRAHAVGRRVAAELTAEALANAEKDPSPF